MRTAITTLSLALLIALSVNAAAPSNAASVQIVGHQLRAGDSFQIAVKVEYTIIDASKSKAPKRSDGARVLDESMIEYRDSGKPVATSEFVVPASGEIPARAFTVRFDRPLAMVPGRLAAVMFHIAYTQTTAGKDGKPKTVKRDQAFPVPLGGESTAAGVSRCVVFEGFPDGGLGIAVRETCAPTR